MAYTAPGAVEKCDHLEGLKRQPVHPLGHYRCACTGCWDCKGQELDCTCDVDWDAMYESRRA